LLWNQILSNLNDQSQGIAGILRLNMPTCSAWLVMTAAFTVQLYSYFTTNLVPIQSVSAFRSLEHILGAQSSFFKIHYGNLKVYKNFNISIGRFTSSSTYINVSNELHILQYFIFCQEDSYTWPQLYLQSLRVNQCLHPTPRMLTLSVNMPGEIKNGFVTITICLLKVHCLKLWRNIREKCISNFFVLLGQLDFVTAGVYKL
jgi:hypothetical protein